MEVKKWEIVKFYEMEIFKRWWFKVESRVRERERKGKQTQLGERKKEKIFRSSEKPRLNAYVAMIFSSHLTPCVTSCYSAHSSSCIHIHVRPSSLHIYIHTFTLPLFVITPIAFG